MDNITISANIDMICMGAVGGEGDYELRAGGYDIYVTV
jgi:hypothetical protein